MERNATCSKRTDEWKKKAWEGNKLTHCCRISDTSVLLDLLSCEQSTANLRYCAIRRTFSGTKKLLAADSFPICPLNKQSPLNRKREGRTTTAYSCLFVLVIQSKVRSHSTQLSRRRFLGPPEADYCIARHKSLLPNKFSLSLWSQANEDHVYASSLRALMAQ